MEAMNNVTQHDGLATVEPDHVTPECEPQMVPGMGDDHIAVLMEQITQRDERIATLTGMVEAGSVGLKADLALAKERIAGLEAALEASMEVMSEASQR